MVYYPLEWSAALRCTVSSCFEYVLFAECFTGRFLVMKWAATGEIRACFEPEPAVKDTIWGKKVGTYQSGVRYCESLYAKVMHDCLCMEHLVWELATVGPNYLQWRRARVPFGEFRVERNLASDVYVASFVPLSMEYGQVGMIQYPKLQRIVKSFRGGKNYCAMLYRKMLKERIDTHEVD